ncbi:MAG: hypothetical protein ABIF08_04135 [Nanoarchaeota archaeon]
MKEFTAQQEAAIEEKATLLGRYPIKELEFIVTEKRLNWIDKYRNDFEEIKGDYGVAGVYPLIRAFFELYMGVPKYSYDISINHDMDSGIFGLDIKSSNFCPYLEACKKLEISSEIVCKDVLEQPLQTVLDEIYPERFTFFRSFYRPSHDYCLEHVSTFVSIPESLEIIKFFEPERYEEIIKVWPLSEIVQEVPLVESLLIRPD